MAPGPGWTSTTPLARLASQPAPTKYVVVNADEGDPGAYIDRILLEDDPHAVLEGPRSCRIRRRPAGHLALARYCLERLARRVPLPCDFEWLRARALGNRAGGR
jgi:hypothetical protein